ncbi:MAG: NAD(P)H-dependent oxidoreductase [Candidatus Competibacteraceae bacterium]
MNILLVYAHPNPRSFNRAILETIDAELCERGHATCIRDLINYGFARCWTARI